MKASINLGKISGIPVKLHITLLIIIGFISWSIGTNLYLIAESFGLQTTGIPTGYQTYIIGIIIAIGLFASVFIHEMAHSLIAQDMGIKVTEISLWIFGGMSNMEKIPEDPNSEIKMSFIGPLSSLVLGAIFFGLIQLPLSNTLLFIFGYLAIINIFLGIFNLIPAFPMDGGRILRALLAKNRSHDSATQIAADVGKILAIGMGIFGLFSNPFFILIAFFVYSGATQESRSSSIKHALGDTKVKDVMDKNVKRIDHNMSLNDFMELILNQKQSGFLVMKNKELVGTLSLSDLQRIRKTKIKDLKVSDIMNQEYETIKPEETLNNAWNQMMTKKQTCFPVQKEEKIVGVLTNQDIANSYNKLKNIKEYKGDEI